MWCWGQGHWVGHSWSCGIWVACTFFHFYHRPPKSLSPFRAIISTVTIFLEHNKVKTLSNQLYPFVGMQNPWIAWRFPSHGPYKWGRGGRESLFWPWLHYFPRVFFLVILLILQLVYFLKTPILQGNISALFTVPIFLLDTFRIKSCCPLLNCPVITHLGNFTQYLPLGICHMVYCTSIF
jgi:hypothetical protein